MAQLMPLPLTVSCFSKIQIGFTFLVPAHPDSPGKRAVKWYVKWYVSCYEVTVYDVNSSLVFICIVPDLVVLICATSKYLRN